MAFTREISRLMFGLLVAFFMIFASASYWAIVGADTILLREDNPRVVEDEAAIRRGAIYDRQEKLLVETIVTEDGSLDRIYYHPETYAITGYFSLRYGTSGVESAYNSYLRGDILDTAYAQLIQQDLLHQPQTGADIRLTIDQTIQQTMADLMGNQRGAAIAISVPDGAILGLVSLPVFDPNTLDADWETLVDADDDPFFNRALQGQYQPGGMLQTPLMVAGILTDQPFETVTSSATRPVSLDGIEITCAENPPNSDLTYREAYAYACPFPFSYLARELSPESLNNIIDSFGLDSPPTLDGFAENPATVTDTSASTSLAENLDAEIVGQGNLTINPLGMATIAGAVINAGNAPQPYIFNAYRAPDTETWTTVPPVRQSSPVMTANAARRLRELMANNMQEGASVPAARPDLVIGAHTALAVSGEEVQTWFIGYVSTGEQQGIAVALVLEDTGDANLAASMGGTILETAAMNTQQTSGD